MNVTELVAGVHATKAEIDFAQIRVSEVLQDGYTGQVSIVGSRAVKGHWLSEKRFNNFCEGLPKFVRGVWYEFLNSKARELGLFYNEMGNLRDVLPSDSPTEVLAYLGERYIGSDIDLLVSNRPSRVTFCRLDPITGIPVEVWQKGEYKNPQR